MASNESNASLFPIKIRRFLMWANNIYSHMWKSVCIFLNIENISSLHYFSQQNEHISVKKMKRMDHVQSCQFFLEYYVC